MSAMLKLRRFLAEKVEVNLRIKMDAEPNSLPPETERMIKPSIRFSDAPVAKSPINSSKTSHQIWTLPLITAE